ncbi:hypothetical protein BC628DRAFT_928446 [Trametes gibbosa]|nr:hypothetical protein BC628DRAFT_928446 [Trametes gibbosa]
MLYRTLLTDKIPRGASPICMVSPALTQGRVIHKANAAPGSRVSLPPSYAVHQPRSDPDTLQRASSPSGMSHHTVLPPYSSAPPSLAYAGARRHVELTRLIRVLEGQLRTHDALHAPAPRPSDPPGSQDSQTPNSLTGAHDAKTRSEKPTRRTRGRERVDARGRAEEEEHAAKRTRLAALLSELTEARTLLAEEAQMRPASEPVLASSTVPDRELR